MLRPRANNNGGERTIGALRSGRGGYDGTTALTDVSLRIHRGDFVGLLGPSGSGKTTLLRSLSGAVDIYSGVVLVEGTSVKTYPPNIGCVFTRVGDGGRAETRPGCTRRGTR